MNCFKSSVESNCTVSTSASSCQDLNRLFVQPLQACQTLGSNLIVPQMLVHLGQPFVTPEGYLSLFVSEKIRIDISNDQSICVTTPQLKCSFDYLGHNFGLIHPLGRVWKDIREKSCHVECGVHLAKFGRRGVTFTSLRRTLVYLVDTSGCKTTTDRFRTLSHDFVRKIFDVNRSTTEEDIRIAIDGVDNHKFETEGTDKFWYVWGIRIRYNMACDELVIHKSSGKIVIHMSPAKDQFKFTTPTLRVLANHRNDGCLQVIKPDPRDEQRVTIAVDSFHVKYGSQKAGFDDKDQLVLL